MTCTLMSVHVYIIAYQAFTALFKENSNTQAAGESCASEINNKSMTTCARFHLGYKSPDETSPNPTSRRRLQRVQPARCFESVFIHTQALQTIHTSMLQYSPTIASTAYQKHAPLTTANAWHATGPGPIENKEYAWYHASPIDLTLFKLTKTDQHRQWQRNRRNKLIPNGSPCTSASKQQYGEHCTREHHNGPTTMSPVMLAQTPSFSNCR